MSEDSWSGEEDINEYLNQLGINIEMIKHKYQKD